MVQVQGIYHIEGLISSTSLVVPSFHISSFTGPGGASNFSKMSNPRSLSQRSFLEAILKGLKGYSIVSQLVGNPLLLALLDTINPYVWQAFYASGKAFLMIPTLVKAVKTLQAEFFKFFEQNYTSSITIDERHFQVFRKVSTWANMNIANIGRNIKVTDNRLTTFHDKKTDFGPRGKQSFHHENRKFWLERKMKQGLQDTPEEVLEISCAGQSAQPLKDFVKFCEDFADEVMSEAVMIFKPSDNLQNFGLPSFVRRRDMSSIDMDERLKADLIEDAKAYFHPASEAYYVNRGIPLRRGYLFYGPPGCGKTSICGALASMLNLDLYTISLASENANDKNLEKLFSHLPKRCIVLLEDIDSAGVERENMSVALHGMSRQRNDHYWPSLTIGGLLNVIDGAGAAEGRLIIMTSNHPETLDRALIRPGRIDKTFYFGHVSKAVAASMFKRIYSSYDNDIITGLEAVDNLDLLADEFVQQMPVDIEITPAELQCFLLEHRNSPFDALRSAYQIFPGATFDRDICESMRAETVQAEDIDMENSESEESVYYSVGSQWSPRGF